MKKTTWISFTIAFVLALAASNFTVFAGAKYALYSAAQALLLVPIGMVVMLLVQRVVAKALPRG